MTNKKSTKRALICSLLALAMCFSMLVGTTFAWFTDSVTSANNIIQSGNLDVELEYWNGTEWKDVKGASDILTNTLWEPGVVEVAYLRLANAGSLAFKYQLGVNIVSETPGVNAAGDPFKLSDYIMFGVVEGVNGATEAYTKDAAGRAEAVADVTDAKKISAGYTKADSMESGDVLYLALVVYMPETVGNDANHNGTDIPEIKLGINVVATQVDAESDAFGNDYDAGAPWQGGISIDWYDDPDATEYTINSAEDLAGLAAIVNGTATSPVTTFAATEPTPIYDDFKGKTVKLGGDVDLNDIEWTPIGRIGTTSTDFTYAFKGTFDGQDHTVYNLEVSNDGWAGLFGIAHKANIKNLKLSGVTLNSNRMTGSVVGQLYGSLDNCHVEDANIMVVPNAVGTSYDNGDKVGGIVGWIGDNGDNHTLTNCSATGVTLGAYRDVGGIAGYVADSTVVSGNKATNVTITVDQTINHYEEKDPNAGAIIGRDNGAVVDTNTTSEITISETYYKNGLKMEADGEGNVVLAGVAENYNSDTITVPEDVTALGSKALNGNTTIKTVILPLSVTGFGGTPNENGTGASGGFFYGSAVEKVVLPEGITEIPAATFNGARNLKEVNIPSSVNTIGINAFAYTGIEELTVPATVTNIGYGAFRGMANLTSVIIEGNVNIPVYAFRTCTNLRTVIIKGSDVTFSNGSMIFTHYDTGDGRGITVYVANETVKERLIAADSAATTYGGYDILIISKIPENEDLSGAFKEGVADTVYVPADKYDSFPSDKLENGDVIVCAPGTVFEGTSSLNVSGATVIGATFKNENGIAVTQTISGTFKDCVFEGSEALRWCYSKAGDTVVFENCVIKTDFRGIHFDGMNGNVIFRNCEINGFNAFGGTGTVTFEGCTFGYDESYYNGLNMYCNTVLKNCEFKYLSNKTNFVDFEAASKSLTIENCTATLDGEEASILDFVGGTYKSQTTIIIDGAQLVSSDDALKAAIEANVSKILLANGNYSVRFTNNTDFNVDDMTIVGMGDNVNLSVSSSETWYGRVQGDKVTFENVNFTSSVGATGKATYNNCTISHLECASSGLAETYVNDCEIGTFHTSTDINSGAAYVKNSTITKAEYSGGTVINFENCTIGELISWNTTTVLTGCQVTTIDKDRMTTNTITVDGVVVAP